MNAKPVILIVEDEFLVRTVAVDIATDAGFDAISVGTADEAIAVLEQRSDIRLVFTDVNMPGSMDGMKLAKAVRERWPPVELIVTTARGGVKEDDLPERGRFLPKPYGVADLTRVLKEMVGTP